MTNFDFYRDAKFITDQPAETDEFSSQAHARVANTLVNIVATGEGGRAIGLEGTWGSGKSTVIDFALAQFEKWNKDKSPKQRVFVFDAWAHQGDPLRRVFLEELIASLAQIGAVDKSKWAAKLEQLRSIRKKTTETRAENLSWVARVTLLALPLFPLAYGLLFEASKANSKITKNISAGWLVTIAVALVASPYVAALLTWLWRRNDPSMKGRSVIWAFNKQTDHVTTEQLVREDEATTVEFNREFDELVADAKEQGNRIVIVLDNLDRLANEQIREIWATMRNFFAATPGSKRREILKNVWLVVPVDRQHIEAVFSEGAANIEEQRTRGFVEKTFEVVLRVPPLLLSSWSSFFTRKVLEAFGEKISGEDRYRVFRLFELYQSVYPAPITPRAIKAYVNKLVGQAKLSGDSIPLEYLSLYVLYRDKISSEFSKLQDSTILDAPVLSSITDTNWTKYLAAAHFNVEPALALEILLAPEIEAALLENKFDRLNELAKTSGFDSILHGVIADKSGKWASDNPTFLFNIAATLEQVNLGESPARNHIWRDLTSGIGSIKKAVLTSELTAAGIKSFVGHVAPNNLFGLSSRLKEALTGFKREPSDISAANGIAWFQAISALAESTKGLDSSEWKTLFSKIPIQPAAPFLFGVAEAAASSTILSLQNFASSVPPAELANLLAANIQAAEVPSNLQPIITSLIQVPAWINWNVVVEAIRNRLQQNEPTVNAPSAFLLLDALRRMGITQKVARTAIEQLNSDGSLHGLLEIERKAKRSDAMSAILCDFTSMRAENWTGPGEHPKYGQLAETNSFLGELQNEPEKFGDIVDAYSKLALARGLFTTVLNLALPADKSREIFRSTLKKMAEQVTAKEVRAPEIMGNYSSIEKILGSELTNRIFGLLDHVDIGSVLAEKKWKSLALPVLSASKKLNMKKFDELVAAINKGLNELSSAELLEVLKSETNELALMIQLKEWNEIDIQTPPLFDALNNYNKELVEGGKLPSKYLGKWPLLATILSDSQRPHFYKGLRDLLTDATRSADVLVRTIALYGTDFLKNAGLLERDDVVVRKIISPLLAAATKESIACVEANADSFRSVIDKTSRQNREFVVERIEALLAKSDDSTRPGVLKLGTLLGVTSDLERAEQEAQAHIQAIQDARAESEAEKSAPNKAEDPKKG